MPLPSAIKLFIDPRAGSAFGNFSGTSSLTNPVFTLGDTATVELYLVESTGLSSYPRQEVGFPTSPGIRVAIGDIDQSPVAGTWSLSYGGNTTTALAFNATPAVVQTALNQLASITAAGGVTVSKIGDNYNILFNSVGARTELTTDGSALIPLSAATVATLQAGSSTKPAIFLCHLQRTVAGLATSFSPTDASTISVESLTAWDNTKATYRVSISPDPKGGSFSLSFDALTGTDVSTAAISVGASALDVQNALSFGALAEGKVSVTQVGAYAYDITVGVQPGTNGLTADGAGLLSFAGYKGELSLNTVEAVSLLDGADYITTTFEVEITSDSKRLTVLQLPCTLKNAVIDEGALQPLVLDTYLSQTVADGRYFKLSQNLADGTASTMRANLGVYSTGEMDTALALKADDGDLLGKADLSGAAFTGDLTIAGRAAIGGGLALNTAHKLAIYNGNIVFSAGYGLAFGDGTVQTTAFTGSSAASWGTITGTLANQSDLSSALAGKAATVHTHTIGDVTSLQTTLDGKASVSHTHIIGDVTGLQTALDGKAAASHTQAISTITGLQTALDGKAAIVHTHAIGDVTGLQTALDGKANLSGATFTGKANFTSVAGAAGLNVGIGGTSTSATTAGDVWIATGGASLNFRDGTGAWRVLAATSNTNAFSAAQIIDTTATTAALRVTQKGTGNVVEFEDSTNPDTSAFVINQNGAVGIGVNPNTYKLQVAGSTYSNSIETPSINATSIITSNIQLNAGGQLTSIGTGSNPIGGNFSASDYPLEMIITLSPGSVYAVPCRQITN